MAQSGSMPVVVDQQTDARLFKQVATWLQEVAC